MKALFVRFFTLTLAFGILSLHVRAQSASAPATAQGHFKNLQVLKDIPADQLIPSMQFMTASLGVSCDHCHVEGAFDKDDKKPKQTAREMMRLMFALNQSSFAGKREVTCYSCHRGALKPELIPAVSSGIAMPAAVPAPLPNRSADEVLAKYEAAIKGQTSQKISTEVASGKILLDKGVEFPIEMYAKAPNQRTLVTHMQGSESLNIFNGTAGWNAVPKRPLRTMGQGDLRGASLDAAVALSSDLKSRFKKLEVLPDQQISNHPVSVIKADAPDFPPTTLYFDQSSGLLLRVLRYVDSPLGLNPTQIELSDYRDVGGSKLPFQWTISQPNGRQTLQFEKIEINQPVDDSKFLKPNVPEPEPPR